MAADPKAKALANAEASIKAATMIRFRILSNEAPDLADAKILEAAGCYVRRALAKGQL